MKWLIASDLHGSVTWCKKLLEAYDREGAQRLLLLGDILNHGDAADADAVAALLNPLADSILAVRGNCDTPRDEARLAFPITDICRIFPTGKGPFLFATHGHVYNDVSLPEGMQPGDILLQGHTHIPATERRSSFLRFNPGSIAQPRYGTPHGYMTMEDGVFLWKSADDGAEYRRYAL